jgi:hypothetical protein
MSPATDAQVEEACMTRGANEASRWLNSQGFICTLSRCNTIIARMVADGKRGKLSTANAVPTSDVDAIRHSNAEGCRKLLAAHLRTRCHWITDRDRFAAAVEEARRAA